MRERPILFSGEMVNAILDGRKTQTRRTVRPQPMLERDLLEPENANAYLFAVKTDVGTTRMLGRQNYVKEFSPFQVGLKLWVRETFRQVCSGEISGGDGAIRYGIQYRADNKVVWNEHETKMSGGWKDTEAPLQFRDPPWKPSIFMPKRHSRLTLEIVSIRVERLQEISEKDCLCEGVPYTPMVVASHKTQFASLWDSLNRKTFPWSSNPFVFVIGFKRA